MNSLIICSGIKGIFEVFYRITGTFRVSQYRTSLHILQVFNIICNLYSYLLGRYSTIETHFQLWLLTVSVSNVYRNLNILVIILGNNWFISKCTLNCWKDQMEFLHNCGSLQKNIQRQENMKDRLSSLIVSLKPSQNIGESRILHTGHQNFIKILLQGYLPSNQLFNFNGCHPYYCSYSQGQYFLRIIYNTSYFFLLKCMLAQSLAMFIVMPCSPLLSNDIVLEKCSLHIIQVDMFGFRSGIIGTALERGICAQNMKETRERLC